MFLLFAKSCTGSQLFANSRQRGQNLKGGKSVFARVTNRFKNDPSLYYSMSIAATWAGVGSLMVGIQMAQEYGVVPFLIWALGNTLACIVFGILAPAVPRLRAVFRSKLMHFLTGIMCIFQVWISMNGIEAVFRDTPLTGAFGMALAYAVAIFFVILLMKFGMIRNVLTDNGSWTAVYIVGVVLTVAAIIHSRGNMNALSLGIDQIPAGIEKFLLLLPGAFLYPYFYEILDYNDHNEDGAKKINVRRAFVVGGLLFGAYLSFTFLLAWTSFSPVLNIVKAFLITLVAVSTISSFLYSIYIMFGKRLGIIINIATIVTWQHVIPLGVLGVWTLMSSIRIFIVVAGILYALAWSFVEKDGVARA